MHHASGDLGVPVGVLDEVLSYECGDLGEQLLVAERGGRTGHSSCCVLAARVDTERLQTAAFTFRP